MKQYKAIFCDIDGTLLTSRNRISDETKAYIREIAARGVPFILGSARMPQGMYPILDMIGIQAPLICYNGGLIVVSDETPLYSVGLDPDLAGQIYCYLRSNWSCVSTCCYSFDAWLVEDSHDPWIRQESAITGVKPVATALRQKIATVSIVHKLLCMGQNSTIATLESDLRASFPLCQSTNPKQPILK